MSIGTIRSPSAARRHWGDLAARWSFMVPTIVLLIVVLAYPIWYTIEISFSSFDMMTFGAGEWVGWDNYRYVIEDYRFWQSLWVTLVYLVFALPIQIVLGFESGGAKTGHGSGGIVRPRAE